MHLKPSSLPALTALALLAAACGSEKAARPAGQGYTIDPATGEHRMTITGREGETRLRSGAAVPLGMPEGVTLFPDTRVRENARVARPGAQSMLTTFEADAPAADIAAHYRDAARAAGFAILADLGTDGSHLLSAQRSGDGASLTLSITQGDPTTGQLTITAPSLTPAPAEIVPWTKPPPASFEIPAPQR